MAASIDDIVKAIEKGFARAEGASKSGKKTAGTGESGAPGSPKKKGKKDVASMEDELAVLEQYHAKLEGLGKTEIGRNARAQQMVLIAEQELKIAQAKLKEKNSMGIADAEALAAAQKKVDLAEENVEKLEAGTDKIREQTDMMRSFGKEAANTLLPFKKSKFFNVAAMGKFWDVMSSGAAATAAGLASFAVGILDNFIGGIMDAIFALDEMESSMMKATGMNRQMARQFADASDDVSHLWITTEEYGKAAVGLYGTMTDFTMLLPQTQNQLAATTSVLAKWGVSAQEVGKSFQFATKMMGRLPEQADQVALEMASFAMNVGVPVDQMMSDFNAMGPQIAKLGSEAPRAFKEMARVAKITGLEIGKLLNLTDKFDTFEGAAEMTGQLNAALGGNFVNAMDMMMETDPVGRFEQLRGALDDAGLTFDDMSYYQRKFFAESMGLESVGDLALMMSGNMDDLAGETNKTASEYEEMAQKAAEQATLQEKFQGFLDDIMRTLVDGGLLDSIHQMFDEFSKGKGPLMDIKDGIIEFVNVLKTQVRPAITQIKEKWPQIVFWTKVFIGLKFAQAVIGMAGPLLRFGKGLWDAGAAAISGVKGLAGWIKAQRAAAATKKALAAAQALENTQDAAKTALAPASAAGDVTRAGGIRAFGQAATAAAGGILAVGAAMLMMGGGIAIAALGMSVLVNAFAGLGPAANSAALALAILMIPFVAFMIVLGVAVYTGVLPAAAGGLLAMGAAALMLGAGIAIAALGMSVLVAQFAKMAPAQIMATAYALGIMGLSMIGLSLGLSSLVSPTAVAGLVVLEGLMVGMAASMIAVGVAMTAIAVSLAFMFDSLSELGNIDAMADSFQNISDAINDVSMIKVLLVTKLMKETGKTSKGGGGGGGGGGLFGGGEQKISISLNPKQTKDFLEGLVVEAQGKQASKAIGAS